MLTRNRRLLAPFPVVTALLLTSCGGGGEATAPPPVAVHAVNVTPATATIAVGGSTQLAATTIDANGAVLSGRMVTWSSSDPATAAVSSAGLVTGVAAGGPVTITASSDGKTGSAQVTVTPPPVVTIAVTPGTSTINVGATIQMNATLRDAANQVLSGRTVTWSSSSLSTATVSSTGLVSAVAPGGPVTITASSEGRSGSAQITVTAPPLASISTGNFHTCALRSSGAVFCWGAGQHGQLGNGIAIDQSSPVLVGGGLTMTTISAGSFHACGMTAAGPYCWGRNGNGDLGDGTTTSRSLPVPVTGGVNFTRISAGGDYNPALTIFGLPPELGHTCGLTQAGIASCWGSGGNGQLGTGASSNRATPTAVSTTLSFSSIHAGAIHTCALTVTGSAHCWGSNINGALGNGTTTSSNIPVAVSGGLSFTSLTAGDSHSCGLTATGAAYCWGANSDGEVGDGTKTTRSSPVQVLGGLSFASITAGASHTCARTAAGAGYCWGRNTVGQLGDGTTTERLTPTPVTGGLTFGTIQSRWFHTCGLTTAGEAYCWGVNGSGQLGVGDLTSRSAPTRVNVP